MLEIRLLGPMSIVCDGRVLALPPSKKTRALLAYLILSGRPQSRERLCDLLWDVPDDPRAALRWSLTKLRKLVDEEGVTRLVADRARVAFDPAGADIDIRRMQHVLTRDLASVSTVDLQRLAEDCGGELLEGLDLPNNLGFTAWLSAEREEAKTARCRLLTCLTDRLNDAPDQTLPYARELCVLDPLDEAMRARLVALLFSAGHRQEAERHIEINRKLREDAGLPAVLKMPDPAASAAGEPIAVSAAPPKSVAVLPFAVLSSTDDDGYFADGLTEEILNSLGALPDLLVTARTSAFYFKGKDLPIREISAALGVAHVVEGSVRRAAGRVRVTAQLIRASDGFHLWSETYDGSTEALFDVQRDIAEKIATALDVVLDDARREAMFRSGTKNVEAFEAILKGRRLYNQVHAQTTRQTLWDANRMFERALEHDPNYVEAAIAHSDAFAHVLIDGPASLFVAADGIPSDDEQETLRLLLADLDRAVASAYSPTARIVAELNREFFSPTWHRMPGLIARFRQHCEIDQLNYLLTVWLHLLFGFNGALDLEQQFAQSRIDKDPLDPWSWDQMAQFQIRAGDFDAAHDYVRRGRMVAGDHPWLRGDSLWASVHQGDCDHAIAVLNRLCDESSGWHGAYLAALRGDHATALRLTDEIEAKTDWPDAFLLIVYNETAQPSLSRALAAKIDRLLAGPAIFTRVVAVTGNTLPFDLADTPNFAARLGEAGIDPASLRPLPRLS